MFYCVKIIENEKAFAKVSRELKMKEMTGNNGKKIKRVFRNKS